MTAPDAQPGLPGAWPRARLAAYAAVLVAVGGWSCFSHLGDGMLVGDEVVFALTTDIMLEMGDYIVPRKGTGDVHLNAAPLYNWLSCLTAGLTPDGPIRYRLWAATFGVLCALAVLLLGTTLFRAEVGLLAGLLLLLDHNFLFFHASRNGVVEPMLLTFVTLMACAFARAGRSGSHPWAWWVAAGVCLGGAVLTKPPVMGGFFFAVLSAHHVLTRRDLSVRARLAGPVLAGLVGAAVALPWYAMLYCRVGPVALDQLLLWNSIGRATRTGPKTVPDPWFYVSFVWGTPSALAKLYWPALGVGVVLATLGWLRSGWRLPVVCVVPFAAALSYANTKAPHYLHLTLPFLCVLVAATLLAGFLLPAGGTSRVGVWSRRGLAVLGVVAAALIVRAEVRATPAKFLVNWEYPPLMLEHEAEAEFREGRANLVLYHYPEFGDPLDRQLGFGMQDRYYSTRLSQVRRVGTAGELNAVLAEGKPTVVVLPPRGVKPGDLARDGVTATSDRAVRMPAWHLRYPVVVFHRAEERLGLSRVLANAEPARD